MEHSLPRLKCLDSCELSFSEIALAAGALAVGVATGSIVVYAYARRTLSPREETNRKDSAPVLNYEEKTIQRLIPKPQLERTKRELRTLLLEKDLVSAALTRLYEAEASHEITREEREILGLKYREELKSLDEKILKIDSFIEVGDLETLREQLLDLVREKIDAIEKRIERAKLSSSLLLPENEPRPPASEPRQEEPKGKVPNIADLLEEKTQEVAIKEPEKREPEKAPAKKKTQDEQVDHLQQELLEALDRLEKLDIEN